MSTDNKNHHTPSNNFVWNQENTLWYAEQYGDHISNDLTIKNIELNPNEILLDIGCGTGTAVKIASRICHKGKIYGIDPIETMINIAIKNQYKPSNIEFILGSAENIPLDNKSVNKVIAINSIHHWEDYNKGLLEVNRVLKSEGLFFISSDIVNNDDCGHGSGPLQTNKKIMKELKNAGFIDITLQDYILEDDGINLIQCKKD
jgi:ubiquinone/menaquinone biosynthesis C-methylase UbiE